MEKKTKQNLLIVIVGVGLFAALMNLRAVILFLEKGIGIILPIIVGGILALFINVPMTGIEKRLRKLLQKRKKQPSDKFYRMFSFLLTFVCVALVLTLVFTLLIPELVNSAKGLYLQIEARLPEWIAWLESLDPEAAWLEDMLADINLEKMMQNIGVGANFFLESVVSTVSSAASIVITAAFGLIISIYLALGKEQIGGHARKLLYAYLKPAWAENVLHVSRTFSRCFANFLSGQCTEAVILGVLMFAAFTIFRLPYGSLVGVLTAVCAIIPYVGAFLSGAVSVILALLISPALAVRCLIVYLVVQFVENQFIYPRVVGGSVGLPPLYTLVAAMIGGKLFGIMGIIFFIPIMAVVIELVKEDAGNRLSRKGNPVI
ncbi:MAG: AI-2E family transporter [Lachnospiraceae bacterium]|nr:AI-2E family transporter [Lachnospiraceae bacterium]RKI81839.1 AI-2E family transporter [bacterium 1xD42-87]